MKKLLSIVLPLVLAVAIAVVMPKPSFAITCGFGSAIWNNTTCQGFLLTTDTSPWTVPTDWNAASNTVELIGAGGGGTGGSTISGGGSGGSGGGGGAYTKLSNGAVTVSVVFKVGTGGTGLLGFGAGNAGGITMWETNTGANGYG